MLCDRVLVVDRFLGLGLGAPRVCERPAHVTLAYGSARPFGVRPAAGQAGAGLVQNLVAPTTCGRDGPEGTRASCVQVRVRVRLAIMKVAIAHDQVFAI